MLFKPTIKPKAAPPAERAELWSDPWMVWRENSYRALSCPACAYDGLFLKVLDASPPFKPRERYSLFECPDCGTLHYPDCEVFEYESRRDADFARKFYLEVGASFEAMTAPLAWVQNRSISSYLEVGGGYGFSVDFATRALGLDAANIDPSFLARVGAADLKYRHINEYLSPDHALTQAPFDLVLSSEVIEHVKDPDPFLAALSAATSDEGALMLTTPNAGYVGTNRSLEALLPIITAGHHLVIYSASGLRACLERSGFSHIHIVESGPTLKAVAARKDVSVNFDAHTQREDLQAYLAERMNDLKKDPALFAAFAVRLFKEYIHTAQWDKAQKVRSKIFKRWATDYGLDLTLPDGLKPLFPPLDQATRKDLRQFATNYPLSLAITLFYSARLDQQHGNIDQARRNYLACLRVGSTLNRALASAYVACLETEDVMRLAEYALIELKADKTPAQATRALLQKAQFSSDEQWNQAACRVFASGTLSGRAKDVEQLRPLVFGFLDAKREAASSLNPNEGYAAAALAQSILDKHPAAAGVWYDLAAVSMTDVGEANVFSAMACEAKASALANGTALISAMNSNDASRAAPIAQEFDALSPSHSHITQATAFAMGLYHLNMSGDARQALNWFARASELSSDKDRAEAIYHEALAASRLPAKDAQQLLPVMFAALDRHGDIDSTLRSRIDELRDTHAGKLAAGGTGT